MEHDFHVNEATVKKSIAKYCFPKFDESRGALWISLCLPSCCFGFVSQAHHLCFFELIQFKLYICHLDWNVNRTKRNKQRPGDGPI